MSEEGLQIAEESRDGKGKGERERYTQLNAQLQRLASKDKKAFSGEQWNEIEGNNRMGKARDLFRKIGDIKGTICPKVGTIKNINDRDLVDAEEIKKRWKEYMQ